MSVFKIGCDPEIFLTKKKTPFSAHGVIPGTKKEPEPCKDGAYQVDGMAVEFNTDPVDLNVGSFEAFNNKVVSVMGQMKDQVKKFDPDLKFNISSVQDFGKEVMDSQPDTAKELGCDPDWCAYTMEHNPRPKADEVTFRTASGHIHVGWGEGIPVEHPDHLKICSDFVKMMDATVGMFMTIIDADPRRRELYGKAGAFRPKPYGVEYRTPSNLWLTNKSRRQAIFDLTLAAVSYCKQGYVPKQVVTVSEEEIQRIINEGDYKKAMKCLDAYRYNYSYPTIKKEYGERTRLEDGKSVSAPVKNTYSPTIINPAKFHTTVGF